MINYFKKLYQDYKEKQKLAKKSYLVLSIEYLNKNFNEDIINTDYYFLNYDLAKQLLAFFKEELKKENQKFLSSKDYIQQVKSNKLIDNLKSDINHIEHELSSYNLFWSAYNDFMIRSFNVYHEVIIVLIGKELKKLNEDLSKL